MEPKHRWGLFVALGILVFTVGSFLAFIPIIGLPMMGAGALMFLIGVIVIMILVFKERGRDFKQMNENISKEELRP
ncbi:MAG: hypothetical protein U9R75_03440 [Candidatus Thermoplasmatota archaeon]|nr:hypothetical protein [Candidatus Thermoplasmatota archaeon]